MNFTKYVENQYQETALLQHNADKREEFSVWLDSEIKALHMVLIVYRKLLMWLQVPGVFIGFILVNLGIKTPPRPILTEMAKEAKRQEELKKN